MPETRKHETSSTDPLTLAVRNALGDVRPNQPGASGTADGPRQAEREAPTARSTLPSTALGSFTFTAAPRPGEPARRAATESDHPDPSSRPHDRKQAE